MSTIYFTSARRKEITRQAISQLRETRAQIDPKILELARRAIQESASRPAAMPGEMVAVDKKKVMSIVTKFIAIHSHNARVLKELSALLQQQ